MAKNAKESAADRTWSVEAVRLTAFPKGAFDLDSLISWEDVVGEPPEDRTFRDKEGLRHEHGEWGDGKLVLQRKTDRADLIYAANVDKIDIGVQLPVIGELSPAISKFKKISKQYLQTLSNVKRLAFGLVLLSPTRDREDGYRQLQKLLPHIEIDPENSSNFLY